jgi:anti-sigma B factor antagonist
VGSRLNRTTTILLEPASLDATTIVTLAGELDLCDCCRLHRAFAGTLSAERPNLVLDLRRVDFIDCSVLRVLVMAHAKATTLGGRLSITGSSGLPLRLLRLTGLHTVFDVHDPLGGVGG